MSAGNVPRTASGQSLILSVPGGRYRTLVDSAGRQTEGGAYVSTLEGLIASRNLTEGVGVS